MKLGEGNWTIKCQTVHAADCAASLLLIITNTSVSFVLFPKKIESSVYFFISTGCFQAMVSAIKIKPFPFVCIATRQLEPHELDNAVSFANPLMTKMWNQEVVGNSSNLWEFLKAEIYFHKVFLKWCCFLFFFGRRSLTRTLPCCTRQSLLKLNWNRSFQVFEFIFCHLHRKKHGVLMMAWSASQNSYEPPTLLLFKTSCFCVERARAHYL